METPDVQKTWLTYNTTRGALPRKAAIVIVYAQETATVLLVRRNRKLAFMGGHHAFPGGGVSTYDTGRCVDGAHDTKMAQSLTTAVREVFEETGALLAEGRPPNQNELENAREAIIAEPRLFERCLEAWGLRIHAENFAEAGRWITPSFSPMRFDTSYYLYRCQRPITATPMGPQAEITAIDWLTPADALRKRNEGTMLLSTPVVFVLQRLSAFPIEEALQRLRNTPGFSASTMDYIEPMPGIHVVPVHAKTLPPATHTNCIIIGETEIAIVDPGISDTEEQQRFITHFDDMAQTFDNRPCLVLLTHNHPDHCAFAEILSRRYDIPVRGHRKSLPGFSRAIALEEGDVVELEGTPPWRIRCMYTPGHHPGHLCFYEENTRTLVCGDMAANPGTIMIDCESGGDMDAYLTSLEGLARLAPAMTIPGHGAPLLEQEGPELFNKTIAHRLLRESRIRVAVDQGASNIEEALAIAYADTPAALYPLARRQLLAHLKRLQIRL